MMLRRFDFASAMPPYTRDFRCHADVTLRACCLSSRRRFDAVFADIAAIDIDFHLPSYHASSRHAYLPAN